MATTKKVSSVPASNVVRFSVGEKEIALANAARNAGETQSLAFRDFYKLIVVDHELPMSAIAPRAKDAARRSNEDQAAYDFSIAVFYTYTFGAEIAWVLLDKNTKKDLVLPLSQFLNKLGKPFKDQAVQAVRSSFGNKPYKSFCADLAAMAASDSIDAKLAAGEVTQEEAAAQAAAVGKRAAPVIKTRQEKVVDMVTELCKVLRREAGDKDGGFDHEKAKAFAAIVSEKASEHGFR